MPRVPADFNGGCYHGAAGIMRSTADSLHDRAGVNGWAVAGAAGVLLGAPLFVAYAWVCCRTYGGDLTRPLAALATDAPAALHRLLAVAPRPTAAGFAIFAVWYLLQAVLMLLLPGRTPGRSPACLPPQRPAGLARHARAAVPGGVPVGAVPADARLRALGRSARGRQRRRSRHRARGLGQGASLADARRRPATLAAT